VVQFDPSMVVKNLGKEKVAESMFVDPKDVVLADNREDMVQGLSGEFLDESNEDWASDDVEGSQAKFQQGGLVKSSNPSGFVKSLGLEVIEELETELIGKA
jgi:hypothetical protein